MRREPRPPSSTPSTKGGELLAAYVDGVGELSPTERKRVELYLAADTTARDDESATRQLIGKLRELPPQGEPDWTALERSIQEAVIDVSVPRPFWKRWQFALPAVLALAGATAIAVIALREPAEPVSNPIVHVPLAPEIEPAPLDETVAVYLDGTDLELAIESSERADDRLDELTFGELDSFDATENLLGDDLAWVDELDDDALRRLEGVLDREKIKGT